MGLGIFNSDRYRTPVPSTTPSSVIPDFKVGDPVPTHFRIIDTKQLGSYLIALIHYPNATNYSGNKLMLFHDMTDVELRAMTRIDPHFDPDRISPIARFAPTALGLRCALLLVRALTSSPKP